MDDPSDQRSLRLVVMGVSGSGKSSVGRLLASRLALDFVDADDLHPQSNVTKMSAGLPLSDADRLPWLAAVADRLGSRDASPEGCVMACSSLRRSYRDLIREAVPEARFVHLKVDSVTLRQRLAARQGHFMPPSLLESQLAVLEPLQADEPGVTLAISDDVAETVQAALAALQGRTTR